ncbi:cutinase-domain-containing protein [Podospora didyma]|uniref:Cutinase n=1 Tax=Podospora didyma TaxID=330526 RepID=A0AAE0U4Q6_9PEZI|nr:cutinase-domain-containing protein [Podospora didyma]
MKAAYCLVPLSFMLRSIVPAAPVPAGTGPPHQTGGGDEHKMSVNAFLYRISKLFPVNAVIANVVGFITITETILAKEFGMVTTQNAVSNGQCADVTIIFARGTGEAGNVSVLVGPHFFEAVQDKVAPATVGVQGVEWIAKAPTFLLGGDADGSRNMALEVTRALVACPRTKVVMSGYSQGSQLVHNAARLLPKAVAARVSSVVTFGSPDHLYAVPQISLARQLSICHDSDPLCKGGNLIVPSHFTYVADVGQAADFVASRL